MICAGTTRKARYLLAAAVVATPFLAGSGPAGAEPVDVALVLAVDVSESVDAEEYMLQHEGIARAFETKEVVDVIRGGAHGAIDAMVLEWSDRDKQVVTVDWSRISDAASAAAFAARVRASARSSAGLTAIGDALLASAAAFTRLGDTPTRRVIDLSGDGMANIGPHPDEVRDGLVATGHHHQRARHPQDRALARPVLRPVRGRRRAQLPAQGRGLPVLRHGDRAEAAGRDRGAALLSPAREGGLGRSLRCSRS